jgi:hypothetical protein
MSAKSWPSTQEAIQQGFSHRTLKRARRKKLVRTRRGIRPKPAGKGSNQSVVEWDPEGLKALRDAARPPRGYVSFVRMAEISGWSVSQLHRWCSEPCPYLGRVLTIWEPSESAGSVGRPDRCFGKATEAEQLKAARPGRQDGKWDDDVLLRSHFDNDGEWVPILRLWNAVEGRDEDELGRKRHALDTLLHYLHKRASIPRKTTGRTGRPRSAPTVRFQKVTRLHPKIQGGQLLVVHLGDWQRYTEWRLSRETGSTPVGTAEAMPSADSRKVVGDNGRQGAQGQPEPYPTHDAQVLQVLREIEKHLAAQTEHSRHLPQIAADVREMKQGGSNGSVPCGPRANGMASAAGATPIELVPGGFSWRGHRHALAAKPRDVLGELLKARDLTCSADHLEELIWADDLLESRRQAVKDAVKDLRKALRKALNSTGDACLDDEPVPSTGSGKDLAYRLALPAR